MMEFGTVTYQSASNPDCGNAIGASADQNSLDDGRGTVESSGTLKSDALCVKLLATRPRLAVPHAVKNV